MSRKIAVPIPTGVRSLVDTSMQRGSQNEGEWIIPCRLITPLFGGGHTAGENDPVTPISAKAIRGQLRYWWRAIAGPRLKNPTGLGTTELLALREAEVFGSSELPSPFDVTIRIKKEPSSKWRERGQDRDPPYGFNRFCPEMYALFPTTQDRKNQVPQILREGIEFTIGIRWLDSNRLANRVRQESRRRMEESQSRERKNKTLPEEHRLPLPPDPWMNAAEYRQQIELALWAYLNFGGLGARSRRGVGAVTIAVDDPRFQLCGTTGLVRHALPANVTLFLGSAHEKAMGAWADCVRVYRDFRQDRGGRRGAKETLKYNKDRRTGTESLRVERSTVAGRSEWPEPDSIRGVSGCALRPMAVTHRLLPSGTTYKQHDHTISMDPNAPPNCFPKAILGLPINFHFVDGPGTASNTAGIARKDRDPDDAELVPRVVDEKGHTVDGNRMASPIITRPIWIGSQWVSAIIVLRIPELANLSATLKYRDASGASTARQVALAQIAGTALARLKTLRGQRHAIAAFESFIVERGFKPVVVAE